MSQKITRRDFLKASVMAATAALIQACAKATPAPTKPAVVEPTKPAAAAATATPKPVTEYKEAPQWAELVKAGKLPPVKDRLPEDVLVVKPVEEVGQYGGTWHRVGISAGEAWILEARLSYSNLVRWNMVGSEIIPHLAKAWEISPDGKSFTFKLRKGMKWSDGQPYNADDWMFWYNDIFLNKDLSPTLSPWLVVGGEPVKLEKVDDYTIRWNFAKTYGLFMTYMASAYGYGMANACAHYMKQFHAKYADAAKLDAMVKERKFTHWRELFVDRDNYTLNVDRPVIFPWIPAVVRPANPQIFDRNPYYWKVDTAGNQLPYLDKVSFDIVENIELANMKMIAGEVDMQLRHVLFKNFPLFQQNKEKGNYRIIQWARGYITDSVIAPNVMHKDPEMNKILGDKKFRWALSMGINRDEIIQSVFLGMAEPNQVSPLSTSAFYWQEQAKNLIKYDPDGANKILDEMGLSKKDADGYRLKPSGKRLTITYEHAGVFGSWQDIGELLSRQWKKLGIELIVKLEARELMYQRKEANDHDMGVWTGSAEFNPLIDPRWFLPFSLESIFATPAGLWYDTVGKQGTEPTGDLRKVQQLYDQIKDTVDAEQQKKLFRQILELDKENLWCIGVCTAPPELVITKNNFRNVTDKGVSDWHLLTPAATMPEQYFFKK